MYNLMSNVSNNLLQNCDILSTVTDMETLCFLDKLPLFCNASVSVTSYLGKQNSGILFGVIVNKYKETGIRYRAAHKEELKEKKRLYYIAHRDEILAKHAKYYKSRKDEFRARAVKYKFGMSFDEYNLLIEKQDNCCAICGKAETSTRNGHIKDLAVDHDHKTGKVRGLLCNHCNTVLGRVNDDIIILERMIEYIKCEGEIKCKH